MHAKIILLEQTKQGYTSNLTAQQSLSLNPNKKGKKERKEQKEKT